MGSNYFGKTNTGSSSRRGKKGNSEKPRQPQRGLGVAQLEKIRLHEEMGCCFNNLPQANNFIHSDPRVLAAYSSSMEQSSTLMSRPLSSSAPSYSFQHNFPMGSSEYGSANIMYRDSQPTTATSWRPRNIDISVDGFQYSQPNPEVESWGLRSKTEFINGSFESGGQNSGWSDHNNNEEIDLELRLSL